MPRARAEAVETTDGANAPGQRGDRVVVGEIHRLGAHARVLVVRLSELLGMSAGRNHRCARTTSGRRDRPRDPAAAADHQHLLVLQR
jgi:hypothetical protein